MRWLPKSPTSIAIGTKSFIKIFDLGTDLMSPTHTINILDGFITDFDFSKPRDINMNTNLVTVYASSSSG